MTRAEEIALTFSCAGETMIGIIHRPENPRGRGVIIVIGGPQYRIGSHRQYVLLARELAAAGYPVLRFDCLGMGDSDGESRGFENIEKDIRAAVDTLFGEVGALQDVALLGLCDGATAISFYAGTDDRVSGIVLVNPWVRDQVTLAQTQIRHHYARRLLSLRFWRELLGGNIDLIRSAREFSQVVRTAFSPSPKSLSANPRAKEKTLPERVGASLDGYKRPLLIVLSEKDLTAQEFDGAVLGDRRITVNTAAATRNIKKLRNANHTYSTREWRKQVHEWTVDWLGSY